MNKLRCNGDCLNCIYDDCISTPPFDYKEWHKLRIAKLKDAGLCIVCRKAKATEKFCTCAECRRKNAERQKAKRQQNKEKGLCLSCGKYPPIEGYVSCQKCIDKHRAAYRAWKRKQATQGL